MNETERYINEVRPLIFPMMMSIALNAVDGICREIIAPHLEAKLGRQLTEEDWQIYQQMEAEREQFYFEQRQREELLAPWNNLIAQFQQKAIDRQKIRDFVWRVDTGPQPITYETLLAAARRAVKNGNSNT